ncbi:MAG: AAA family ATPase [Phycisphaerae bacterium]|nr:AAA family ATPase [Saprospiraceae bacterium]
MIKEILIASFRSIDEAILEPGRITVLTGANNSGKSSILYALQVFKNLVTNPSRSVDELLNLGFLNLGGLKECSFMRKGGGFTLRIELEHKSSIKKSSIVKYEIGIDDQGSYLNIGSTGFYEFKGHIDIAFPYPLNKVRKITLKSHQGATFSWNGVNIVEMNKAAEELYFLKDAVELPIYTITHLEVVPTQRGFTKPIFNTVPLNDQIYTEDEVATLLAIDKDVQAKVAYYFEKITGKRFSISIQPGMGFFYMQVREADGSFSTELVNQGMGMNQIVFLLTKILYGKNRLICIDEPEIHLHPSLIEQFVRVLVEIAKKEDKQFIFSTHSEHWLLSLLAEVNDGNLAADDLKVYYLQKNDQETSVEQQKVMPNGQLEGGLKNFMESQMRLAERFFDTTTA